MTLSVTLKTQVHATFWPSPSHTRARLLLLSERIINVQCEQVSYRDGSVIHASADCHLVRFATSWISIQTSKPIAFILIRKCLISKQPHRNRLLVQRSVWKHTTNENFGEVLEVSPQMMQSSVWMSDCKKNKTLGTNAKFHIVYNRLMLANKLNTGQCRYIGAFLLQLAKSIPWPGHTKADSHYGTRMQRKQCKAQNGLTVITTATVSLIFAKWEGNVHELS